MADTPTLDRLESQIAWYSQRSRYCQRMFKSLKVITIVAAASIPLLTSVEGPLMIVGALGALIVVVEGLQQLNQYQTNWTTYRSTAETLKHEKYLHAAKAGPGRGHGKSHSPACGAPRRPHLAGTRKVGVVE